MAKAEIRGVILVEDLYEDLELWYPLLRLREEGATVSVVRPSAGQEYKGKHGYPVVSDAGPQDFAGTQLDAVIVPGGYAPDRIRRHPDMIELVRDAYHNNAIVAYVCHGGWVPVSAGIVKGKKVTSFFAIEDDMVNAGAEWVDEEVVRDGNLISSRKPDDLPAFCRTLIAALSERG